MVTVGVDSNSLQATLTHSLLVGLVWGLAAT